MTRVIRAACAALSLISAMAPGAVMALLGALGLMIAPAAAASGRPAAIAAKVPAPGAPGAGEPARRRPGDPGCRVHIDDVRMAGYRGHGRPADAAFVAAYVSCRLTVRHMSLQVTLWKAGLFYDHEQAQTTARTAAGRRLGSYTTHVACKDRTASRFYGVAHAVVYFGGRRGDAWVRSARSSMPRCGT